MEIDIYNTTNQYEIIYTDPPWKQSKGNNRKCRPNQNKQLDYNVMELSDIKDVHKRVSHLCEDNHNIFMWTIDKYLFEAEEMMKELGYELHARIVWDKENGVAPAFTLRYSHEYLLWFYKKGKMLKPDLAMRGKYTTVLRELATKHSKKPECAYQMLESLFPTARKLELFSRINRPGWDAWGNQVGLLDNDTYKLSAIVSQEDKEDFCVSFISSSLKEVKEQAKLKDILAKACSAFQAEAEMFVEFMIEKNEEYLDSDTLYIEVSKNKVRESMIAS